MNDLDVTNEPAQPNPHPRAATPAVSLFPGIRLDQVLCFEAPLLLALRHSKNWQDPATPSWLGSTLCALAATIGPMVRLFLPGGMTVSPMFNVILGIDANSNLGFYKRILEPIKMVQLRVRLRGDATDTFLMATFEEEHLREHYRRAANGGLLVVDTEASLLHKLMDTGDDMEYAANLLIHYDSAVRAEELTVPRWDGSVHALLTCHRDRLPELGRTSFFRPAETPHILILPEDCVHYDIPNGHNSPEFDTLDWLDLASEVTGWPTLWSMCEDRMITCSEDAALPLVGFREELKDIMKLVNPTYRPFLEWLPDLVASLATVLSFVEDGQERSMKKSVMEQAVIIGKWLANCHYQGVREALGALTIPATPDTTAIPDTERRILTTLRRKGPMKPRDLARSLNRVSSSDRNSGIEWLVQRNLAVWTPEGLVRAEK
jgi:hypothetical protein